MWDKPARSWNVGSLLHGIGGKPGLLVGHFREGGRPPRRGSVSTQIAWRLSAPTLLLALSLLSGCGEREATTGAPAPPSPTPEEPAPVRETVRFVPPAPQPPADDPVELELDGDGATILRDKSGKWEIVQGETAMLPEGFPGDVPLPPGGTLTTVLDIPGLGPQLFFTVETTEEALRSEYAEALQSNRWRLHRQDSPIKGGGWTWSLQKDDRTLEIEFRPGPENWSVTISLPSPQ